MKLSNPMGIPFWETWQFGEGPSVLEGPRGGFSNHLTALSDEFLIKLYDTMKYKMRHWVIDLNFIMGIQHRIMKIAICIFFFNQYIFVIRLETPEPISL